MAKKISVARGELSRRGPADAQRYLGYHFLSDARGGTALTRMQEFDRPPTTQAAVLEELRRMIISREVPLGQPIRQDEIAKRFGVSRVPVREALKSLEAEGIVDHVPHYGFYVPDLTADDLVEIYTIRQALEETAVRRTIELADAADLSGIEMALTAVDEALAGDDLSKLTAANRAFHFALLEPSEMPRLVKIVRSLWDSLAPYRPVFYMHDDELRQLQVEHRGIVTAIKARDTDRAIRSMSHHRSSSVRALREAVEGWSRASDGIDPTEAAATSTT